MLRNQFPRVSRLSAVVIEQGFAVQDAVRRELAAVIGEIGHG
jgi:hypothetical protein